MRFSYISLIKKEKEKKDLVISYMSLSQAWVAYSLYNVGLVQLVYEADVDVNNIAWPNKKGALTKSLAWLGTFYRFFL